MSASIKVDPSNFIGGPFKACPKCGGSEFGVLIPCVGPDSYTRRCKSCWHTADLPLPKIKKKVIYIDQSAFSNIMKILSPETQGHKRAIADPFWRELYEALDVVCHLQLAVCPDSLEHDDAVRHLTIDIAATMLSQVLPEDQLHDITFEEIIAFRCQTQPVRKQFISDVEARLGQLRTAPTVQDWLVAGRQVLSSLRVEFQNYQAEFAASRDKVWPGIASSLNNALVSGSIGAVAMSYIRGPGQALLGSIVGASIGMLKAVFDWRAESKKLQTSAAPSIAYLSTVASKLR